MRQLEIRTWLKQLNASFGNPSSLVDLAPMKQCYEEKRYTDMIVLVRNAMGLEKMNLRVGYVKAGGPRSAYAWIQIPLPTPVLGSHRFQTWKFTMYVRKPLLEIAGFVVAVMSTSHEFAHVALHSTGHVLRDSEEATDLMAMYRGFRHVFITPNVVESGWGGPRRPTYSFETPQQQRTHLGYLDPDERRFAASLMGTHEPLAP